MKNIEATNSTPEAGLVRETGQASPLAEVIASFVAMIQRINDIDGAQRALREAAALYDRGEVDKAKDLALGIFGRLKQIGKAPKDLDIVQIQHHLQQGNYGGLSEAVGKVVERGKTKRMPNVVGMARRIGKIQEKDTSAARARSEEIGTELKAKVQREMGGLDERERELQVALGELVSKIVGDARVSSEIDKSALAGVVGQIRAQFVGNVNVGKEVESLSQKVGTYLQKGIDVRRVGKTNKTLGVGTALLSGNFQGALEAAAGIIVGEDKQEQAFLDNLATLFGGLKSLKDRVEGGVPLQEAIRVMSGVEIREVRKLLSSLQAVDESNSPSPYYDARYSEMVKNLGLDSNDIRALIKMSEVVDVEYTKAEAKREVKPIPGTQDGDRSVRGRREARVAAGGFYDADLMVGEDGNPIFGMENTGLIDDDGAKYLYERGEKQMLEELYEVLPNGTIRARNFAEQEAIKRAQLEKYGVARGLQENKRREELMNIDLQGLFEYMKQYDTEHKTHLFEMIDFEYYSKTGVAKLAEKYMIPENDRDQRQKEAFESWWYQEASFNQRSLAYEGLFDRRNQSPRMKRLNSLMEIIGVGTEKKGLANWMAMSYGMIDKQNNAYVDAKLMGELAQFWTNQGVDFRLEDMLKQYREEVSVVDTKTNERKQVLDRDGKVATVSVMDVVTFFQQHITDTELRSKLGIPSWWKGKFGTLVYKYSESKTRSTTREAVWHYYMKNKLNIDIEQMDTRDLIAITNKYQLMFDLAFQYSVVHKQLHMMFGNASFDKNSFELPGACAEMHIKLDPFLYAHAFAPRYQWLNVAFKEGWALFDPGVRDYVAMAPQDYAAHLVEAGVSEERIALDTHSPVDKLVNSIRKLNKRYRVEKVVSVEMQNGAPTVFGTFIKKNILESLGFGGNSVQKTYSWQYEEDGSGTADTSDAGRAAKAATEISKIFSKALWHWGKEPEHGHGGGHHGKETDILLELGVYGDQKSAYRRPAGEVAEILAATPPTHETLELIEWDRYCEIAKNPQITAYLMSADPAITPEMKWQFFAKSFGEGSFNHSTPSAKRSGDHPYKYGFEAFNKYVETFLAWIEDPFNAEKFDALLAVPASVNAGIVNGLAQKNIRFLMTVSEFMGARLLGGKGMWRIKRDPKTNLTKFDTSRGMRGEGDSEYPAYAVEKVYNDKMPWDPLKSQTMPGTFGMGVIKDKQILLDLLVGMRAKSRLPDELYSKLHREISNSMIWEDKYGPLVNVYKLMTGEPFIEWAAMKLGITEHELKHILEEKTEKTVEKLWHNLNSVGGGH